MGGQTGRTESDPLLNQQVRIGNRFIQIKCNKVLNRIQNFGISLVIENKQEAMFVTCDLTSSVQVVGLETCMDQFLF